jgi:hypothetical protein
VKARRLFDMAVDALKALSPALLGKPALVARVDELAAELAAESAR